VQRGERTRAANLIGHVWLHPHRSLDHAISRRMRAVGR
jgi:hypothetical protein